MCYTNITFLEFMSIEGIKTLFTYVSALILGIIASLVSLMVPMKEEVPQLLKKPVPTPILLEETRSLSKEEETTMSGSFIKEFEILMSSRSGNGK